MQKSEYRNIYENEEKHFFYKANHRLITSLLRKFTDKNSRLNILDAGCGTGLLAQKLQAFGSVEAIDINSEAIKFAKKRNITVKQASINNLPFKNSSFDVAVSIDVIYHQLVKNDQKALTELYRVLRPGGLLIVRVPANKWLTRSTDNHVYTRERYSYQKLKNKLKKANFKIIKLTYINMLLLPPAILSWFFEKLSPKKKTTSPLVKLPGVINDFLYYALTLENYLLTLFNLPFGLGLIALARKHKN